MTETRVLNFETGTGLRLVADATGPEDGPVVLLLHGGGQTRHSWGKAATALGDRGFCAVALDLRGHGDSDWAPDGRYGTEPMTEDVRDVIATIGRPVALVGASLGGLVSLRLASDGATSVLALVLVDVVPRVEAKGADEIVAFMSANPHGFASVEAAADSVAAYLPHRTRPPNIEGLNRNLRLHDGRYYWHWDPAMLTAPQGGLDEREAERRAEALRVQAPTLLVHGGRSRVVSGEGVTEFRALIPHAEAIRIDDADHMVAGDANDAFNRPLIDFLSRAVASGAGA